MNIREVKLAFIIGACVGVVSSAAVQMIQTKLPARPAQVVRCIAPNPSLFMMMNTEKKITITAPKP